MTPFLDVDEWLLQLYYAISSGESFAFTQIMLYLCGLWSFVDA